MIDIEDAFIAANSNNDVLVTIKLKKDIDDPCSMIAQNLGDAIRFSNLDGHLFEINILYELHKKILLERNSLLIACDGPGGVEVWSVDLLQDIEELNEL